MPKPSQFSMPRQPHINDTLNTVSEYLKDYNSELRGLSIPHILHTRDRSAGLQDLFELGSEITSFGRELTGRTNPTHSSVSCVFFNLMIYNFMYIILYCLHVIFENWSLMAVRFFWQPAKMHLKNKNTNNATTSKFVLYCRLCTGIV